MAMLDVLITAANENADIDDTGIREEVDTFVFEVDFILIEKNNYNKQFTKFIFYLFLGTWYNSDGFVFHIITFGRKQKDSGKSETGSIWLAIIKHTWYQSHQMKECQFIRGGSGSTKFNSASESLI